MSCELISAAEIVPLAAVLPEGIYCEREIRIGLSPSSNGCWCLLGVYRVVKRCRELTEMCGL